jgi:lambda family phage portal protein
MAVRKKSRTSESRALAVIDHTQGPVVRSMGGALEGAERTSKETLLWNPSRLSPDQIINGYRGEFGLKAESDLRGRDIVMNDGYAQGIVDINRDNIVGVQYKLNAQPNYNILSRQVSKSFDEEWAQEYQEYLEEKFNLVSESRGCYLDAAEQLTFTGIIRLAIAGYCYTGEVVQTAEWFDRSYRPFKTAVQTVSPTRLSNPHNTIDTRFLRNGVVRDIYGKPTGYWFRQGYPTEFYDPRAYTWKLVQSQKPWGRRQVIHIRDTIQPDQTRGISELVAILAQMRMTKKFQQITLQNAVINASYAATIESELPTEVIAAAMGSSENPHVPMGDQYLGFIRKYLVGLQEYLSNANGIAVDGAKMPHLFPGTKLNARPLGTPGGVGTEFEVSLLRHIAAGLGISYEEFAKDFSRTNYSSARASLMTTEKHMMAKKKFVADRDADEIFLLWLEEEFNSGKPPPLPRNQDYSVFYEPWAKECFSACDWIGSGRGQIDPLKETQASVLKINSGLSTHEIEISKAGGDWRKYFRQLSREQQLATELGINLNLNSQLSNPLTGTTIDADETTAEGTAEGNSKVSGGQK